MSLVPTIEKIDGLLSRGALVSEIKPVLVHLHEQASALDAQLAQLEIKLKQAETQREIIEDKLEGAERFLKSAQETIAKLEAPPSDYQQQENRTLRCFFDEDRTLEPEQLEFPLDIKANVAKAYCDSLRHKGFLRLTQVNAAGRMAYEITPKGRQHIVKLGAA